MVWGDGCGSMVVEAIEVAKSKLNTVALEIG
jgi:hypothetical protein